MTKDLKRFQDFIFACQEVESKLEGVVSILDRLTGNKPGATREDLFTFQERLAEQLFVLSQLNSTLIRQKTQIVRNKSQRGATWAGRKLKMIATCKEYVRNLSLTGKSIGDAFIWLFYRRSKARLKHHRAHPSPGPFISHGVGIRGEIEFIKNFKQVGKFFILYHGVTNLLRIGDLSLYDFESDQIAALGELKTGEPTHREEDNSTLLSIQLVLISQDNLVGDEGPFTLNPVENESSTVSGFGSPEELRVGDKQLDNMASTFKEDNDSQLLGSAVLERPDAPQRVGNRIVAGLSRRKGIYAFRNSKSLVVLAIKLETTLAKRLSMGKRKLHKIFKDAKLTSLIKATVAPRGESVIENHCLIYEVRCDQSLPGLPPLYWWFGPKLFRALASGRVVLVTIFNPANVLHSLVRSGFVVERDTTDKRVPYKVTRTLIREGRSGHLVVENLPWFWTLLSKWLGPEELVVESLLSVANQATSMEGFDRVRINLDLNLEDANYSGPQKLDSPLRIW